MPGLIMTHVPSELTRRTAPEFSETPHTQPATGTSFSCSSTRQPFSAPQMTISAATQPTQSATGLHHGGAACAMMSASSASRISRPVERLRLREWLKKMIETQAIQGLHWIDKERQIVKIPWKHAARHGWSRDKDACLFRAWAIHTKKYDPTTDSPKANPKVWKANFRCAINSLPDIEELRERGKTKGNDAYKVYRLHPKKSKRQSRDTEGAKVTKRQRSTSKSRGNKIDKKQRKRNNLIIPSAENFNKLSDHSSITKLSNASDDLAEDLIKKRMAEIRAACTVSESAKSDRMRLNVQCVFKQNGSAASAVSSTSLMSPMSPPSTLQSPTTPVYPSSMSTNGLHFASQNYSTGMTHSSTCVSPCSTTTSTPATTPQSPPPYHIAVNNRQGMMGFNMEARFELSHNNQLGYGYDDLSDSDCSSGNMSEKEVANLVFELKDQSPGHSPRSVSPLDGNNNLDSAVDYSPYWSHQRHHDNRAFFGNNCDIMAAQNSRSMTTDLPGYEPTPMMTQIKVEPETHPSMQTHQHNSMLNGYATPVASLGLPQHQGAYAETSNYLLHQL